MDYAYRDGPPAVIKGQGILSLGVHFILKSFDTIQSKYHFSQKMYSYDAVIIFLNDKADNKMVLDYVRSPNYLKCVRLHHSLTIIGSLSSYKRIDNIFNKIVKSLGGSECYGPSEWQWNNMVAYNWSTRMHRTDNLWIHIITNKYRSVTVSYNSEIMLRAIFTLFDFFNNLLFITYSNMSRMAGMEQFNIPFLTLTREGDLFKEEHIQGRYLLIQFNVLNIKDYEKLLKEEMKQLAYHLPRLATLCNEIINIREMKYTGKYIKTVLNIEELNSLKICLEKHYSLRNMNIDSSNVPTAIVDNPLGNGAKQDGHFKNRTQDTQLKNNIVDTQPDGRIEDSSVEIRIGNIQLLKSLTETLQEFTEELRKVRQLQEQYTKAITKDIREIKEKLKNNGASTMRNQ